jgi:hypothetical protein
MGALIAGQFKAKVDDELGGAPLSSASSRVVTDAKTNPLAVPDTGDLPPAEANRVESATSTAAESGFHLAMLVGGVLMIVGGISAGIGIQNPERRDRRQVPLAAAAGEGARCDEDGHSRDHVEHDQAPAPA